MQSSLAVSMSSKPRENYRKYVFAISNPVWFLLLQISFLFQSLAVEENQKPFNYHYIPPVSDEVYSQLGDINIGEVANVFYRDSDLKCLERLLRRTIPEDILPSMFAVDWVNRNPDLLPNVTLGLVLHPGCKAITMQLVTTLPFLPRSERICNGTDCYIQQIKSKIQTQYISHDVIGILAPIRSEEAMAVSSLLTAVHLPIMGYIAGSNELDYKGYHPYFFRVNTQDRFQIMGIIEFIVGHGWTYIQMVYRDTDSGRDANKFMHYYADLKGVCIAGSHILERHEIVATALVQHPRARVVVFFLETWRWNSLLQAVDKKNRSNYFIWIGSSHMSGYNYYKGQSEDPGIGAFNIFPYAPLIPELYDRISNLDIHATNITWLKQSLEYYQECNYEEGTCKSNFDILNTTKYVSVKYTSLKVDAVLAFAHAAHDLLQDRCPTARGKEARACITGELLREYLLKVRFKGFTGMIQFTRKRSVFGNFTIRQIKYGYSDDIIGPRNTTIKFEMPVALYHTASDNIIYLDESISWSHLKHVERIGPIPTNPDSAAIPESVCSRPCIVGEYKIVKDLPCCWDCLRCRDNERLINRNTGCEACSLLTWPDISSNLTTCIDIPPTYQTMQDILPIVLISVAAFVIILTVFIFSTYIKYRNERVVKASSRELSVIQLVGIFAGYTTVILFQTMPTHNMCRAIFFLFCMSFAFLYCPLLVKTIRIVRIFKSAAKNKQPKFISPQSQLVVAICLIAVQLLLCGTVFLLFTPGEKRTQPIWSEKMVELSCDFTLPGLASFLGYNIFLVCLCSVFAFMVRKLPDNYNESRFITMCVSTTLLIWMAFIPTYFTTDREYIRMFLLCMALILNHSVALTLLFLPKLYAAKFLTEGALNFAIKK